ncbi:hypothetical protein OG607_08210 [Streptomyces sp. NBC_01537]
MSADRSKPFVLFETSERHVPQAVEAVARDGLVPRVVGDDAPPVTRPAP